MKSNFENSKEGKKGFNPGDGGAPSGSDAHPTGRSIEQLSIATGARWIIKGFFAVASKGAD